MAVVYCLLSSGQPELPTPLLSIMSTLHLASFAPCRPVSRPSESCGSQQPCVAPNPIMSTTSGRPLLHGSRSCFSLLLQYIGQAWKHVRDNVHHITVIDASWRPLQGWGKANTRYFSFSLFTANATGTAGERLCFSLSFAGECAVSCHNSHVLDDAWNSCHVCETFNYEIQFVCGCDFVCHEYCPIQRTYIVSVISGPHCTISIKVFGNLLSHNQGRFPQHQFMRQSEELTRLHSPALPWYHRRCHTEIHHQPGSWK